jgi:hypothetical protein
MGDGQQARQKIARQEKGAKLAQKDAKLLSRIRSHLQL